MDKIEFVEVDILSIVKKKHKHKLKTYNFSVEDDESYLAKNIVVHNCRDRYLLSTKGL